MGFSLLDVEIFVSNTFMEKRRHIVSSPAFLCNDNDILCWKVRIFREGVETAIDEFVINENNLPARKNKKKTLWTLPKREDEPVRLAAIDEERVIELFKERKKIRKKNEWKRKAAKGAVDVKLPYSLPSRSIHPPANNATLDNMKPAEMMNGVAPAEAPGAFRAPPGVPMASLGNNGNNGNNGNGNHAPAPPPGFVKGNVNGNGNHSEVGGVTSPPFPILAFDPTQTNFSELAKRFCEIFYRFTSVHLNDAAAPANVFSQARLLAQNLYAPDAIKTITVGDAHSTQSGTEEIYAQLSNFIKPGLAFKIRSFSIQPSLSSSLHLLVVGELSDFFMVQNFCQSFQLIPDEFGVWRIRSDIMNVHHS